MLAKVGVNHRPAKPAPAHTLWLVFGDVRRGEGSRVALFGLQIFLLLTAYYLLKTVREPLILLWGIWGLKGDELKIYATSVQALLLLGLLPFYGVLAGRLRGLTLVRVTLIAFVASLAMFIVLGKLRVPIAAPFYMWLGIVGLLAVGIYGLMGLAAALYALSLVVVTFIEHTTRGPRALPEHSGPAAPHTRGVFSLVMRDRYLVLIGVLLIVANLVNTQGEYILAATVKANAEQFPQAAREAMIGQFYGTFYSVVNTAGLVLQAFLVSRVLQHGGARLALFLLPLVALGSYTAAENSMDYSIQSTVRQTLFLPTTREIKYKGKATIDTVSVRLGDMAAGGLVLLCLHVFGFSPRGFAIVNVVLIAAWLGIVAAIAHRHRGLVGEHRTRRAPKSAPAASPPVAVTRKARTGS
jgi:AAA family ATP:ADP antiporter